MRDYKVIREINADKLERKVNHYLEIGYVVTGGAFIFNGDTWCQVVVLT